MMPIYLKVVEAFAAGDLSTARIDLSSGAPLMKHKTQQPFFPSTRLLAVTAVFALLQGTATALPPGMADYDPSGQIRFSTPAGADARRQELVTWIWPDGLPTGALPSVTRDIGQDVFSGDLEGLDGSLAASVDQLDANIAPYDYHATMYLVHPKTRGMNNARLVILNSGHRHDGAFDYGVQDAGNRLLSEGFTMILTDMPFTGFNTDQTIELPNSGRTVTVSSRGSGGHRELFCKLIPGKIRNIPQKDGGRAEEVFDKQTPPVIREGEVYRFFLEPFVQGINHFLHTNPEAIDVSFVGLSGGGWSGHMVAAIDTRIRQSFPVAGAYPLYCRTSPFPRFSHDVEQYYEPLYRETDTNGDGIADTAAGVASWLEIFALGGFGTGRLQIQILNRYDTCCFFGDAFKTYDDFVSGVVDQLGRGDWDFHSDTTHKSHVVSADVLDNVIMPALHGRVSAPTNHGAKSSQKRSRYLLLDSRIIEKVENARLTVGTVKKHPDNPLFGEDKPWEARFDNLYANVVFDQEAKLYKCWYSPFIVDRSAKGMTFQERLKTRYRSPPNREMGVCYATSRDGIHWEKAELGLVEFNGSTANNLVYRKTSKEEHEPHGAGIFKDLHEPDGRRRYKMFFKGNIISVAFSADGIHWGKALPCPEANVRGDTHNNALWAPTRQEYVGITRTWAKPRGRQVARTSSQDFLKWTKAEVVLEGLEDHLQTYAMPTFYYAGVYLGLVAIYNSKTDRTHTELTWSPDTVTWNRIDPGNPLIANSDREGDYDWGCVYAAAYPIFEEDHIRLYYGGSDGLHFGYRSGSFCLATLRPDGFAGYKPSSVDGTGILTTKALKAIGDLVVNADVLENGFVRIRLLDHEGKELARAREVSETTVDTRIEWLNEFGTDRVHGPVRLEFKFHKATIYSFSWQ